MRRITVGLVAFTLSSVAWAQQPCEVPRLRDLAPLSAAIALDKAMAQTFLKASQACQMSQSDGCDAARLECANQLASTLKAQVGLDDGAWLRDMLLPYGGLSYPPTRQFQPGAMAMDTACNGDANQLMAASSRRSLQAARRQAIVDEYPRYTSWVQDQARACKERAAVDEARRAQERADAERLAAIAVTAKTAEEARQAREAELRRKAEAEAKAREEALREAERKQKEAQERAEKDKRTAAERAQDEKEAAEKKAKEEREAAERRAEEAREAAEKKAKEEKEAAEERAEQERKRQEAKEEADRERAEKAQREAKEEREAAARKAQDEKEAAERKAKEEIERAKAEAEQKAREAEELRLVTAREERKLALRNQKSSLLAQADEADKRVAEISGMTFTAEQAQQAAQLSNEKVQAAERSKTLRAQAAEIIIDDSDERSRGSLGAMIGGGASTWPGTTSAVLGGQALFHLGFWGTAPSEGLASGFEVRVLGRFLTTVGAGSVQQAEGVATARYFFGRFGIGAAMEVRWNKPLMDATAVNVGFGPSVGITFVDTPKTRVMLNASWLPLTQLGFQNPYRTTGDLEISHEFLTFSVAGGLQTQPVSPTSGTILAWYLGAFGGVRLKW
ncbi:MAG: hypothetical protein IAE78_22310 [Myxococcus sp.]|nr:hypothetical protein [Myxococcus sp.]